MILNSPTVSGSLTVTGNTILSGSINVVGGLTGTASFATTAVSSSYSATATSSSYALASTSSSYALASTSSSYALASTSASYALASTSASYALASTSASYALATTTASYGLNALSSSNAMTASSADTLYVRNNVTALGSITAQTLIVQTVTSSVLFTTGSNKIGSSLSNTQELTGSVGITGSLSVNTNGTEFQVNAGGVNIGNALTDNHIISGSLTVNANGLFVSSSGNVGIGTASPTTKLHVYEALTNTTAYLTIQNNRARNAAVYTQTTNGGFYAGTSIGTDTFNYQIYDAVAGEARLTISSTGASTLQSVNAKVNTGGWHLLVQDNTSMAAGVGGGITFNGYKTGTSAQGVYAAIDGIKENGTAGNELGAFRIWTSNGTNLVERMRITSAGNVGIGNSNGTVGTLNVTGRVALTTGLFFSSNLTSEDRWEINGGNSTDLTFVRSSVAERMRITSAGNVGIGTSSPSYTLDVNGTFRASSTSYLGTTTFFRTDVSGAQNYGGSTIRIAGGTGTSAAGIQFGDVGSNTTGARGRIGFLASANNGNPKEFAIIKGVLDSTGANTCNGSLTFHTLNGDNGTEAATRMTIDGNGSIGAPSGANIYNASDIRLKKNISTVSTGLDSIMALNPVKFNWIDNFVPSENGKDILGFIAQEVLEVLPEAVEAFGGNTITVDTTTVDNPLRVNEKYIIPVLVKAIQELKAEIDILKNR